MRSICPEGRGAVGRLRVTLGRPTNRSTARQSSVKNDTFTHNDRSELTAATLGTDAYSYSYDNIGNRKTAQEAAEEATAYDANNLNQYTAIQEGTAEAFVPTFDADGNQTKVKTSTGIWNVVYNAENRPVTFTSEDGATVVECTYDYMGRRHTRKITVNGSVTNYLRYIYRGYLQIAAINAVSGVFQWFILWDPTQPVATRPLGIRKDGTWYTYGWDLTKKAPDGRKGDWTNAQHLPEGRGAVRRLRVNICEVFGSDGYIKTAYTYTPYGSVTANGNVTQPIQWSSEYNDTELGLVYYNYRHYNPADGRWTGRDVKREASKTGAYSYLINNPIWDVDELGNESARERKEELRKQRRNANRAGRIKNETAALQRANQRQATANAGVEAVFEIADGAIAVKEIISPSEERCLTKAERLCNQFWSRNPQHTRGCCVVVMSSTLRRWGEVRYSVFSLYEVYMVLNASCDKYKNPGSPCFLAKEVLYEPKGKRTGVPNMMDPTEPVYPDPVYFGYSRGI